MEELKDYAEFGIRDDMVSKDSSLNTPDVTDNIEFSGYNEGVPGESFLLGGIQMRKKMYADTTAGIWIGIDSDGKAKTNIGDSTNSVKWNGSTLAIAGALSASSFDIPDTTTANSIHVNTAGDTWWGATTFAAALASISKAGLLSAIGLTSLNSKTYTCFEAAGRFSSAGTGTRTFDGQGLLLESTATSGRYITNAWSISTKSIFLSSPTFSCVIGADTLNAASGNGDAIFMFGEPGISGTGVDFSGYDFCGFYIEKTAGVVSLYAAQNNSNVTHSVSTALTTLSDGDTLDLIFKMNGSASIDYYWRKNDGSLSAKTTISTKVPTAAVATILTMATSNHSSAFNFAMRAFSAAYER